MSTFATMAPLLWARGWRGLIPLRPSSKAPAIADWPRFNRGQSEADLSHLLRLAASRTMGSGVGACAGNGILFIDLDIKDPAGQARAQAIAEDLLDVTPLIRSGSPPKTVMMYRSDAPGSRRNPRGLAVELYGGGQPATGQVVLAGVHPTTRLPYSYPRHRPSETDLAFLPFVHEDQLDDLVEALAADPLIQAVGRVVHVDQAQAAGSRLLSTAWRARRTPGGSPAWIRSSGAGGRHGAAVVAVVAALRAGSAPDDEAAELEALEIAFREAKPESDPSEWRGILRWARRLTAHRNRRELERRLGVAHG